MGLIKLLVFYTVYLGEIIYSMIVYRIYEDLPQRTGISYGRAEGRWNDSLHPVIYTSSVPSLCMMELYSIHGSRIGSKLFVLSLINIDIEESKLPYLEPNTLPENWNISPHENHTQNFGNQWLNSNNSLFLKVPSARIPIEVYNQEYNVLINPTHPDFSKKVKPINEFRYKFNLNRFD